MTIVFSSRANHEVRRILEYYAREASAEVAFDFHSELKAIIERIKRWPLSYSLIDPEIRRALLRKFPFQVVFRIEVDERIRILAIRHHKQDSDFGLDG
jgi:toxin ParE1/3/4